MASLVTGAAALLASALAPSSSLQYQRAWARYSQFTRSVLSVSPLPSAPSTIALYISHLVTPPNTAAPATLATNISAIAYVHKLSGAEDPTSHFLIRKILKGAAKLRPAADQRVPITHPILLALIQAVPRIAPSAYDRYLLQAMFTTMFHGFLRIGEVTASPHNLQYHQVMLSTLAAEITFTSYKHHQGQPFTLSIPASTAHEVCPVLLLKQYLILRGTSSGPLFCSSAKAPIQPGYFRSLLAMAKAGANLSASHITPHSFRIGAATYAATRGLSSQQIQAMGRWKSSAFQKYVRISSISLA